MSQWGVISESGIITAAPKGKAQAEAWADYKYRPGAIGDVGERLIEIPDESSHELDGMCEGPEMETIVAFCACGETCEGGDEAGANKVHADHADESRGLTV